MKCAFCGANISAGIMFVRKTGERLTFCSAKCERAALRLGRKPRKVKWTEAGRKARGKA